MQNTIAIVLGGGRGTRLFPLTQFRAKPAVPLAAKYRLIDIPLSNCINSQIKRIYVLTQFLSVSLHRHIRQTYRFDAFSGGFVELLAAQQTMDKGTDWYEGTADAVRKSLKYLDDRHADYVLILSGDQLYRMDFREMMKTHVESGAEITIAGMPVDRDMARSLGIMRCNDAGRVVGFCEKPQTDEEIAPVRTDPAWIDRHGIPSKGRDCLASMGIYLFNRRTLVDLLTQFDYEDFGREVFPKSIESKHVQTYLFDDYWEDIGTIRAFYEANLSLVSQRPPFELAMPEAPVYSRARFLPPSVLEGATIRRSMIADGCRIGHGAVIENSIIGLRSVIGEGVTIRNSILMGADEYETRDELKVDATVGQPPIGIGTSTVIEGAIVDKNCRIGTDVRVVNSTGIVDSSDAADCIIRDGIPVIGKDAVIPDGWTLPG